MRVRIRLRYRRIGSRGGLLCVRKWTFALHKGGGLPDQLNDYHWASWTWNREVWYTGTNVSEEQMYQTVRHHIEKVGLAVTISTRIREMLISNLGRGTSYPVWGFRDSPPFSQKKYRDCNSIRPQPLPSQFFPNYDPTIRSDIIQMLAAS
jgi:hypothetical protein